MKMERTTTGLRDLLFDELENFMHGRVTHDHVTTTTKISNSILATVSKDLEAAKLAHAMSSNNGNQPKAIADLGLNIMLSNREEKE